MGRMASHMKWKRTVMFETSNQHWLIIIFPIKSTTVGVYPISRHPHLWLRKDTPMDADI